MTHPLPTDLLFFADALMTVPPSIRVALATSIMSECEILAAEGNARDAAATARDGFKRSVRHWGQQLQSVCLAIKHDAQTATGKIFTTPITTRDGIQAFEVALAALLDKVRQAEAFEVAA